MMQQTYLHKTTNRVVEKKGLFFLRTLQFYRVLNTLRVYRHVSVGEDRSPIKKGLTPAQWIILSA
jgi:hypothetical protein